MHANLMIWLSVAMVLLGLVFPFIPVDKSRVRARWAKLGFTMVGFLCVLLGLFKMAKSFHWIQPATDNSMLKERVLCALLEGFALGLIFALIVSGELFGRKVLALPKEQGPV